MICVFKQILSSKTFVTRTLNRKLEEKVTSTNMMVYDVYYNVTT